jgi:hypothetical protein
MPRESLKYGENAPGIARGLEMPKEADTGAIASQKRMQLIALTGKPAHAFVKPSFCTSE